MNNTAGRGVVLAAVAVLLGAVILWQGFGSSESAVGTDTGSGATATPTTTSTTGDTGGGDASTGSDSTGDVDTTGSDSTGDDGTETTTDTGSDAGADVLHPNPEVRVKVVNGTFTAGAAGGISNNLSVQNYTTLDATNATNQGTVTETIVYYLQGYSLDARNISGLIGAKAENVLIMPAEPPVAALDDAHVLVVVGDDLVG